MRAALFGILWFAATLAQAADAPLAQPTIYTGIANASAAMALDDSKFLVADDEDNVIAVYDRSRGGAPLVTFDLNQFLETEAASPEVDIEGATRIGDRVYWISSHGRNRNGKLRPSRLRLFATTFSTSGGKVSIEFVGQPYKNLLTDIAASPKLAKYHLDHAMTIAPKEEGGFNIEGLAATPNEKSLLVGLRNPIYRGKAIVISLDNPAQVVAGQKAEIGDAIELDLGGLGVRSMEYWPERKEYAIAAGPPDAGRCWLYTWSGSRAEAPRRVEPVDFTRFTPEAFVIYGDSASRGVQFISDDGKSSENLAVKKAGDRTFRAAWAKF